MVVAKTKAEIWESIPLAIRKGYLSERLAKLNADEYPLFRYKQWFKELVHFHENQLKASAAVQSHRYILYGGSRGPGKSYWLRWELIRFLLEQAHKGRKGVVVGLFCESYRSLEDRQINEVLKEFPTWLGTLYKQKSMFELHPQYGGGQILFRNLDDPSKYQSVQFAFIAIDEITKNKESVFSILKSSLRWPGVPQEELKIIGACNPEANWVRDYWVTPQALPKNLLPAKHLFKFVDALPDSNPYLDKQYWEELELLPDALKEAYRYGNWWAGIEGLVYGDFSSDEGGNVVLEGDPRGEVNRDKPIELAIDDGYIDARATLFIQKTATHILVFDELYQTQTLPEVTIADIKAKCKENKWPLPIVAAVSHEAVELRIRVRSAGIPARNWASNKMGVGTGSVRIAAITKTRGLIKDGNNYRTVLIHERCKNLLKEIKSGYIYEEGRRGLNEKPKDGNDHAIQALEGWVWLRIKRNSFDSN